MERALAIALNARFNAAPNPAVGCVISDGEQILGEGWTQSFGGNHAEIEALQNARDNQQDVAGATVFVTLEPCNHTGNTGPCTEALIEAGVRRVVAATGDPDNRVQGGGFARLKAAGIEVETGLCQSQARHQLRGFLSRQERGRPWVRVKLASSLDGRTAMASGESAWISSEESRRDVQFLRAEADCILSGSGTVLQDDPSLNVRLTAGELGLSGQVVRQPLRAIVDSQLRTGTDARIFTVEGDIRIYSKGKKDNKFNYIDKSVNVISSYGSQTQGIDLSAMLEDLARVPVNLVHVEAGATLCGALLEQGLVDEIVLYIAPHLMGNLGKPQFILPGLEKMRDRIELQLTQLDQTGPDIRLTLQPIDS